MKAEAFWENYDGDRSIAGILRNRYQRRAATTPPRPEMLRYEIHRSSQRIAVRAAVRLAEETGELPLMPIIRPL